MSAPYPAGFRSCGEEELGKFLWCSGERGGQGQVQQQLEHDGSQAQVGRSARAACPALCWETLKQAPLDDGRWNRKIPLMTWGL